MTNITPPSSSEEKKYKLEDVKGEVDVEAAPVYDDNRPVEFAEKGLFLGSGKAITRGGPLGAFLGYFLVGCLVTGPDLSIAEMSALVPLSGGIIRYAEYFFDPALGFADGWNLVYGYMVSLPAEIVAAAVIVDFWVTVNNAIWITIFGLLLVASNIFLVRIYGETEFVFASLKILLVVGLNLMSLVLVCGGGPNHDAIGFRYWRDPGPFLQYLGISGNLGRFLGFYTTFSNAIYAYSGIENISMAAAETVSPRRNIPIAAKRIFWRACLFYVLSIFFVGMLVPSNDENLLRSTGDAAQSPFVIAATRSGVKVVPHIINAVVLTSAWSAGNSGLLNGSRVLYGLPREGGAPRISRRVNRWGIPYVAVLFLAILICLGFMSLSSGASTVFSWLQDLVSVSALVNWTIICMTYLRFYYAMNKQGIPRERLPWKAPFQPYAAWVGACSFIVLLLTGGYTTFLHGHWDNETFVSSYINVPIILILCFGYKFFAKTKIVKLEESPIMHFIEIAERNPEPPARKPTELRRFNILWS